MAANRPPDEALRQAVAAGAANALSVGAGHFQFSDFEAILPRVQAQPI